MVWPVDELLTALRIFTQVALADPLSFILVVSGALLLGVTGLVAVVLVGGAIIDLMR
ncbi:MAG: hypothetical protein ACLFR6_03910 [Salinarchaeum sp.]